MTFFKKIIIFLFIIIIGIVIFFVTHKKPQPIFNIGISRWNSSEDFSNVINGFKDGLKEDGFIEKINLNYIEKNPNADPNQQLSIIQDFVNHPVNLLFTLTTMGTMIAKNTTSTIPIVFSIVTYPVQANLIASLQSSKNNLVGTRNYIAPEEQFYFFKRAFPKIKTLAYAHHLGEPNASIQFLEFKQYLELFDIKIIEIAASSLDDLALKLKKYQGQFDSIYTACDVLTRRGGEEIIIDFAKNNKIPNFTCSKNGIMKGALMGYVTDPYSIGKLSGHLAAAILNGSKPKWLLTESPKKGLLGINLDTANLVGITFPKSILQEADFLIDHTTGKEK